MDGNLFTMRTPGGVGEVFETLLERPGLRLERIESHGEATPPGDWYDQADDEWVVLLCGAAGLRFEGDETLRTLAPGDYVFIPRHRRHRVEWTAAAAPSVWLALHLAPAG
ncbi:cupin 2 domain-containing protein [Plasticicumulans lactativorans]|uniref:Cupin 2 domain-containing protein n=1 Tax=Plasticicumulans lactativorans TaxID=1133106 RepID=A0A4R2L0F1_9GAMM|nr:cupin domain-containing protein [Plasticicumulans lactativorans]TCO80481.1 cupin 2 domain-containing protein [Plasticicumulans lactativorans]